ncbi:glioma pathogenesis-related protein 1-like [Drosophila innubila]|uniref:glioma pathogenesis-related protein 1-like n=1 Tax=Drosophila innubila TaxID=198719 RepID=UPI00148D6CA9|nr:glioma pathogenesis-related protein 1-like [Drosophila innubila]
MTNGQNSDKSAFLIFGHNGLRNRLAMILNTCDMLRMSWDDELAELSNRHHRNCERKLACSSKPPKTIVGLNRESQLQQKMFSGNSTHLARNHFFHDNIYSTNFIESAVGNWYMEHTSVEFPTRTISNENDYYQLMGDNSFTHIINPQTYRVGCSYARFPNGLSLICYYFPYVRNTNNTLLLRLKPKDYQCPYNFPISDPVFKRLCGYAVYL